jgi:hypothetical protein
LCRFDLDACGEMDPALTTLRQQLETLGDPEVAGSSACSTNIGSTMISPTPPSTRRR